MRKNKLTIPSLQLQLAGYSLGLVTFALVFQYLLVTSALSPLGSAELDFVERQEFITSKTLQILLMSLGVVLPLTLAVGILSTFRIAGPISRFATFLAAYSRGEKLERLRLRRGDRLHDLAELINRATVDRHAVQADSHEQEEERSLAA